MLRKSGGNLDSVSETRLKKIYPRLADLVRKMADTLAQEKIVIRVVQALRTIEEQDALFAQGRTKPGKIVTNARGGQSYHNFGLAVDCVPSKFGPDKAYDPDWNEKNPSWKRMIDVGTGLGLNSGATWRTLKDFPHFQLTGKFPESAPDAKLRALFEKGGMQAVWDAVSADLDAAKPLDEKASNA